MARGEQPDRAAYIQGCDDPNTEGTLAGDQPWPVSASSVSRQGEDGSDRRPRQPGQICVPTRSDWGQRRSKLGSTEASVWPRSDNASLIKVLRAPSATCVPAANCRSSAAGRPRQAHRSSTVSSRSGDRRMLQVCQSAADGAAAGCTTACGYFWRSRRPAPCVTGRLVGGAAHRGIERTSGCSVSLVESHSRRLTASNRESPRVTTSHRCAPRIPAPRAMGGDVCSQRAELNCAVSGGPECVRRAGIEAGKTRSVRWTQVSDGPCAGPPVGCRKA